MSTTHVVTRELATPEELGLDTRAEFRRVASVIVDQLPEGSGQLVLDLGKTRRVDSAGLGALMLVQRRAAERRVTVRLRDVSDEVRFLLVLTKLDDLFILDGIAE